MFKQIYLNVQRIFSAIGKWVPTHIKIDGAIMLYPTFFQNSRSQF